MEVSKLSLMKGGWFIGDFSPSLYKTKHFEVATKFYKEGQEDLPHYHKVATEYTVLVSGRVEVNGIVLQVGDILKLSPGEISVFKALEDSVTVVVKVPCVKGDKYLV